MHHGASQLPRIASGAVAAAWGHSLVAMEQDCHPSATPIQIAIIGAGITALHLYHALRQRRPEWSITIYEAADSPREDGGAAVGIGKNGQQALKVLDQKLYDALLDAGAVRMDPHVRFMVARGPQAGEKVKDVSVDVAQMIVRRSAWLERVRGLLPDDAMQMGKQVTSITETSNENGDGDLTLHFADDTTAIATVIIGCDGINSTVRRYILPQNLAEPTYTRGHNHRILIPIERAREAFGETYCSESTQHGWIGTNGFALTDILDNGKTMQVIAGFISSEPWPHSSTVVPYSKEQLAADLESWGSIGASLTKAFTSQPGTLFAAAGRVHQRLIPTLTKGRICIAGDAAGAFPPFLGAGAGLALEDAAMLAELLASCEKSEDFAAALKAYDELRRPRREDVARSSLESAGLLTGRREGVGVDVEALRGALEGWGMEVWEYDVEDRVEEAVKVLQRHKGQTQ